jgi:AAHS family 4-hydroxybenzoate transporter-like MFS transporter
MSFALIGQVAPSYLGSTALEGLTGLFLGAGSSGLIAMTTLFYPTAMRSTGVGWAMGMGRFGSFTGPLLVGLMVGAGWDITATYGAVGAPALVAAVCTAVLGWRHGGTGARGAAPVGTV